MAGDGEVIPNGSVHWHIRHIGKPANWTNVQGENPNQQQDIAQDNGRTLVGIDPAAAPDDLNVTLRFRTQAEAETALAAAGPARIVVDRVNGVEVEMWELNFTVPWQPKTAQQARERPRNRFAPLYFSWGIQRGSLV